jgi:hypothetical protein
VSTYVCAGADAARAAVVILLAVVERTRVTNDDETLATVRIALPRRAVWIIQRRRRLFMTM